MTEEQPSQTESKEKYAHYELVRVESPEDWIRYHQIRQEELFINRKQKAYNADHPDEQAAGNYPFLLKMNGVGIGTTRLDVRTDDKTAIVRLVAITKSEQGKGYGSELQRRVEDFARSKGVAKLLVNAAPEAEGFYEKIGFSRESWDPEELKGNSSDSVQMSKVL